MDLALKLIPIVIVAIIIKDQTHTDLVRKLHLALKVVQTHTDLVPKLHLALKVVPTLTDLDLKVLRVRNQDQTPTHLALKPLLVRNPAPALAIQQLPWLLDTQPQLMLLDTQPQLLMLLDTTLVVQLQLPWLQ